MDDGGLHAAFRQPVGGFETQQPAADDDGFAALFRRRLHRVDIVQVAEGDHAGKVGAGQGQADRVGAGGEDQPVIADALAVMQHDLLAHAVDGLHPIAEVGLDAVAVVPVLRVGDDLVEALFPGQHRRKLDAVVGGQALGADDRDVEARLVSLEDFLDDAAPGHAGADDDKPLFVLGHANLLSKKKSPETRLPDGKPLRDSVVLDGALQKPPLVPAPRMSLAGLWLGLTAYDSSADCQRGKSAAHKFCAPR